MENQIETFALQFNLVMTPDLKYYWNIQPPVTYNPLFTFMRIIHPYLPFQKGRLSKQNC